MFDPASPESTRIASLQPTAVNAILGEMRQLQSQGKQLVSLMRGEPDFRTPAHIVEAANRSLANGRTGYPDNRGEIAFRQAIAEKLLRDNKLVFDPATEILVTTGATLGIFTALMALVNPGDGVLLPDPIYDAYQSPIRLAGGHAIAVPATIEKGRFTITEQALEAAVTPTSKVLLLNTPWNPVGTVFTADELLTIAAFCQRHNLFLISDEIYEAITYSGACHISPLTAAPFLRDRTVLVNSLSKTYSMTGWRVGYCAGPKRIIDAMFLALAQSSRGPATFVQDAAAVALTASQDSVVTMVEEYSRRRTAVLSRLATIAGVQALPPQGGFFAMADVRELGLPSKEIRRRLMHDHGVVVVDGAAYGQGGEGTLRVSFASGGNTLAVGLDALAAGLTAIQESLP